MWDESREAWRIPDLQIRGGVATRERDISAKSRHRPETDYARRRREAGDPNPRFRTDDIVDLELSMPAPRPDDINTPDRIAAILAMEPNDPVEKIRFKKSSRAKHRERQYFSVNDGSSKSRSRRKKEKGKASSRPTTAM